MGFGAAIYLAARKAADRYDHFLRSAMRVAELWDLENDGGGETASDQNLCFEPFEGCSFH